MRQNFEEAGMRREIAHLRLLQTLHKMARESEKLEARIRKNISTVERLLENDNRTE